jgi:hypothetical protein
MAIAFSPNLYCEVRRPHDSKQVGHTDQWGVEKMVDDPPPAAVGAKNIDAMLAAKADRVVDHGLVLLVPPSQAGVSLRSAASVVSGSGRYR